MTRKPAELIKPGDVIMPPERELRLWMRREIAKRGLTESALHLTVIETYEGSPDKRGRWVVIKAKYPPEWNWNSQSLGTFTIKARPETNWAMAAIAP